LRVIYNPRFTPPDITAGLEEIMPTRISSGRFAGTFRRNLGGEGL
jgi:hypothetical protein